MKYTETIKQLLSNFKMGKTKILETFMGKLLMHTVQALRKLFCTHVFHKKEQYLESID